MKIVNLIALLFILMLTEPAIANNETLNDNLKASTQSPKIWLGKWIAEGNGKSCALLISPDGSWYFMNNYSGKDAEGYFIIDGSKLQLARELDARERMVYSGRTSILYFECRSVGSNSIQISPVSNQAGIISGGIITLRKQ